MNEYIFSICIPVYATEKYLPRALESIINQNYEISKVEVIIINDASPNIEECTKIIDIYANQISIKYVKKNKNEGSFLARKEAVQRAQGKYLLFLDADDTIQPYTLDILSRQIVDNPDYIQFRIYSVENMMKTLFVMNLEDESNKTIVDVLKNKAIHNLVNKCYNVKFLKEISNILPNFYAIYAEDYYHSVIIEYYSKRKVFIDIPMYNYFRSIGVTSDSSFESKEKLVKIIKSFKNIEDNLIVFFNERNCIEFMQYVKEYINSLYLNLASWTNSIIMIFFILKIIPYNKTYLRNKLFTTFIKNKIKCLIKNMMPFGLVQFFANQKKRKGVNMYG